MTINSSVINGSAINGQVASTPETEEVDFSESLDLSTSFSPVVSLVTVEASNILGAFTTNGTFVLALSATLEISDETKLAFVSNLSEPIVLADTLALDRETVLSFVESLVTQGGVETVLHGMFALAESLAVTASFFPGVGAEFIESILRINDDSLLAHPSSFLEGISAADQSGLLFRASMPLSESLALVAIHNTGLDAVFTEALGVDVDAFTGFVASFTEALNALSSSDALQHANLSAVETLSTSSSLVWGFKADLDASIEVSEESVLSLAASFAELLAAEGQLDSLLYADLSVSEAIALTALHALGLEAGLTESVVVEEEFTLESQLILAILEAVVLGDTPEMTASILIPLSESVNVTAETDTRAALHIALLEGLEIGGVLNTPEGTFTAWVVNAETKAPWQYDNYPFNSFAFAGNKYLALTDSGLYELTGSDDDGTNIDTVIRTGLENFGSNQKKSIPWAYFGYTSSGRILFKTITTATGKKVENWYELEARTADDDTETRVNIGRGLRSVYWQFELTNIDGAEFEFDDIQLMPARLKRRL